MIRRIGNEWAIFILAVQFLTRIPIPAGGLYSPERLAAGPRYYPAVGLLIGGVGGLVYWLIAPYFEPLITVLISVIVVLMVTGAFHEDGLADTFDGFGGAPDRQRMLDVMKDSRIGVYGFLALTATLALKVAALTALPARAVVIVMISAHGLSRLSSVLVMATSQYVRDDGLGKPTAENIGKADLAVAMSTGFCCIALIYYILSPAMAAAALIGLILGHALIRYLFERRIGGYTGDCLGATQQVSEVSIYLAILVCLST